MGGMLLAVATPGKHGAGLAAGEKSIVVGQPIDLTALDPYSSVNDFAVWKHIMEPLVTFDFDKRQYVGVLAPAWRIVDDDWVFDIRQGVRFHDGSPLTAQDVKFSLERAKQSTVGFILGPISEVDAIDDRKLRIRTKAPFANLLARIKHIVISSKMAHERLGEADFRKNPIGTGPFAFTEWKKGVRFVVRKATDYWGEPVDLDQIAWQPIPEEAARVAALEAGSTDVVTAVPTQEVDRLNARSNVRVEPIRVQASLHIGLSQRFEPFRNVSVRRAMNHAIDVDSLIKDVLDGRAYRAMGVSGPTAIGYDASLAPFPHDPAKAKALLAEAGYPNGFAVDFYAPSGRYPKDREMAQAIADQLAKVGITANPIFQEHTVYWNGVMGGKWPMVIFSGFNEEDPELFLAIYFETGVSKRLEYSNASFDESLKKLRVTFDPQEQDRLAREINAKVYQELVPTVPLYHPQGLYGINRKLSWKPAPNEEMYFHRAKLQ